MYNSQHWDWLVGLVVGWEVIRKRCNCALLHCRCGTEGQPRWALLLVLMVLVTLGDARHIRWLCC